MGYETLQAQLMLASLSEAQVTLISEAIRMGGRACKPIHRGRMGIAGRKGTVDALVKRELAERVEDWAVLTDKGLRVLREIRAADGAKGDAAQARQDAQVAEMLADQPSVKIMEADAAAMWADRGISPMSLANSIDGVRSLIPAYTWESEVMSSVAYGIKLADQLIAGEFAQVCAADMWILDETVDCVNAVYAGLAPDQVERAYAQALSIEAERAHQADVAAADELIRQGAEIDQRAESGYDITVATWGEPGDAERAYDAENARLEGADIEAEQLAEVEFEAMLARLGMDMGDYAECQDQLAMEREGCIVCGLGLLPCPDHASVEAWVAHLAAQEAAQETAQDVAGVTTPSAWKASNGRKGKFGKHARGRK